MFRAGQEGPTVVRSTVVRSTAVHPAAVQDGNPELDGILGIRVVSKPVFLDFLHHIHETRGQAVNKLPTGRR